MFNGENRVLKSVNSLFAELWIKPGLWDDFEEYLVNSSARVANVGANGGSGSLGIDFSRLVLVWT